MPGFCVSWGINSAPHITLPIKRSPQSLPEIFLMERTYGVVSLTLRVNSQSPRLNRHSNLYAWFLKICSKTVRLCFRERWWRKKVVVQRQQSQGLHPEKTVTAWVCILTRATEATGMACGCAASDCKTSLFQNATVVLRCFPSFSHNWYFRYNTPKHNFPSYNYSLFLYQAGYPNMEQGWDKNIAWTNKQTRPKAFPNWKVL